MTHHNTTPNATQAGDDDWLWGQRWELLSSVAVTCRYHRRRQRFFDLAEKLTLVATVALGGGLLGTWLQQYLPVVATIIASLGLLSLIFGYSQQRQKHKELGQKSAHLLGQIEGIPWERVTTTVLAKWHAQQARINAAEPPALQTLITLCEHEHAVASGHPDHIKRPVFYKRWTADFISW